MRMDGQKGRHDEANGRFSQFCKRAYIYTFSPKNIFMSLVRIPQQIIIISLYKINVMVVTTEAKRVYCAVRNLSLNIIQVKFH